MMNWFRKNLSRFAAVYQLMSAVSLVEAVNYILNKFLYEEAKLDLSSLLLVSGLLVINLFAGWSLLSRSKWGYQLSLINLAAQVFSFNTPALQYHYEGLAKFFIGTSDLFTQPMDLKSGYIIGATGFSISTHVVAGFPTIEVNLIVLLLLTMLYREYRSVSPIN